MTLRRSVVAALVMCLALASGIVALPRVFSANGAGERLTNGDFEEGFGPDGVALGWSRFDNGGQASYGWYDETWGKAIYEGKHAQLIEINSFKWFPTDPDRYAGIFQTVSVVPGATYQLVINAMMRTTEANFVTSGYGYRVQFGVDFDGGQNWQSVATWHDIGLNDEYPRTSPGKYYTYVGTVTATSTRLTLYVRGWKKWAQPNREFDLDIDAISLKGTTPADTDLPMVSIVVPPFPMVGKTEGVQINARNDVGITEIVLTDNGGTVCSKTFAVGALSFDMKCDWTPPSPGIRTLKATVKDAEGGTASFTNALLVGNVVEFLSNGDFEGGFGPGNVANAWTGFNNGGRTSFGYHHETWQPAVYDGANAQLLEIDTWNMLDNDADRYIGIYQKITGLTPGAPYQLVIRAMMRTTEANYILSGYGYRVQYGVDYTGATNWQAVNNWTDIGLNTEYPRLSPGPYYTFTTWVTPSSNTLTLYIRGWKKWAQPNREFDLDLDGLSLRGFQ